MVDENIYLYRVEPSLTSEDFSEAAWFEAKFSITNLDEAGAKRNLPELQAELEARPYLRKAKSGWDEKTNKLLTEFEIQSSNAGYASKGAARILEDCLSLVFDKENLLLELVSLEPARV